MLKRSSALSPLVAGLLIALPLLAQDVDRITEILGDIDLSAFDEPRDFLVTPAFIDPRLVGRWLESPEENSPDLEALVDPEFHLRDGGLIQGRLVSDTLPLRTPYGSLEVPTGKLIEVHFFVQPSLDVRDQIHAAVAGLGAADFAEREKAGDELRELFPDSLPYLREALASKDEEIREQAERLVSELDARLHARSDLHIPILDGQDTLVAQKSSIRGVVERELFAIETRYGKLEVPRQDLVRIVFRRRIRQKADVVVPSAALATGNWMKTTVQVYRGRRLKIEAGGRMQVRNWGESCGPEGSRRHSRAFANYRMLTLVGRVGEAGEMFKVGRSFDGRAKRTGVLYLAVIPFRYSSATGSYKAAVEVR